MREEIHLRGTKVTSSGTAQQEPRGRRMMRSLTTFEPGAAGIGRLIPRSSIPLQPVLSLAGLMPGAREAIPAVIDQGTVAYVTAGRMAIALALDLMHIRPGEKVLIPAFHCNAMVEPVIAAGAQPLFYRINDDLGADLKDIAAKIDRETRVLLVPHYFGFPQDMPALRAFCDERRIALIEDCAHAFFGISGGRALGSLGDFAIASLTKFFPVRDGGCLIASPRTEHHERVALSSQGFATNFATFFDTIEEATEYDRLRLFGPLVALKSGLRHMVRTLAPNRQARRSINPAQNRGGGEGDFDASWKRVAISTASRLIVTLSARRPIVANRRRNYERLSRAFTGVKGCRPLMPELPEGVVPYMFPLWLDRLPEIFDRLEDDAVPMARFGQFPWHGLAPGTCPVSTQLSRHAVQFPCHQELTDHEMQSIIDRVGRIVG
jgi:perosamine synthetase